MLLHYDQVHIASVKKYFKSSLSLFALYVMCLFSLAAFNIFAFITGFEQFDHDMLWCSFCVSFAFVKLHAVHCNFHSN